MNEKGEARDKSLLQELAEKQARLQREIKINGVLASLSKAIISPDITNQEISQRMLDQALDLTESQHGIVSSVDQDNGAHVSNTLTKMQGEECSEHEELKSLPENLQGRYQGLWGYALNIRKAFFTNQPALHPAAGNLPDDHLPLRNYLAVPVMFRGELLGQIALANSSHDYHEEDLELVERLSDLFAMVLHNRRREAELVRLATTDHLTGLWNRRQFMQLGQQEFERVKRYGGTLTVLVFDIDHFKLVNDRFGHKAGDEVLRGTAAKVLAGLRSMDAAGRLGGEELAVVLPETGLDGAMGVAERLRKDIENARYQHAGEGDRYVTASFGATQLTESDRSFETIMNRADHAMYRAKEEGRNRVCGAGGDAGRI